MGLCVSKSPRWIQDPDNFGRSVYATPIPLTREEKRAAKKEDEEWVKSMRARGHKVGKVKTEKFSF